MEFVHTMERPVHDLAVCEDGSVVDESQDHAVQVDEEAQQVEAQFDHGFLHVGLELASVVDLCGIVHSHVPHGNLHVSVNAPRCHGEVEQEHKPVHGDQH